MTPERAKELAIQCRYNWFEADDHVPSLADITDAILLIANEEGRAALTEAIEVCRQQATDAAPLSDINYQNGCDACARRVERIRDKPQ